MPDFLTHPLIKENTVERRLYQETIIASACRKNSLVVLPTGIGKTMIAIGVSAMRLAALQDSKILILAPTKPLVEQHKKSFENVLLAPSFGIVTGADSPNERESLWKASQVIFATPQVVQNDILTGKIDLNAFSLVVFDEAHRTRGDYAYTFIAKKYIEAAQNPLILGLTASPGGTEEKIGSICGNLFIENVEIRTESDPDVSPYVHDIKMNFVEVDLPEDYIRIKTLLESALEKKLEHLRKLHLFFGKKPVKRVLLALQGETMRRAQESHDPVLFGAVSACSAAIKLNYCLELLQTQGLPQLQEYVLKLKSDTKTKAVKSILADEDFNSALKIMDWAAEQDEESEHPKLERLKAILEEKINSENPGKKAIIFSQYVSTVEKIVAKLQSNAPDNYDKGTDTENADAQNKPQPTQLIKPVKFIGQRTGNTQKNQIEILNKFRAGEYNTLVATSIGEEGLDIPQVDVIIFYETVPSEIRAIQRRGRTGRANAGDVYVLVSKGTIDQAYNWVAKRREKKMRSVLSNIRNTNLSGITITDEKPKANAAENATGIEFFAKEKGEEEGKEDNKGRLQKENGADNSQTLLEKFASFEKKPKKPIIYTDIRETKLLKALSNADVEIEAQQLEVGDFLISDRIGVERKTTADFLQSIIDGRLFAQLAELSGNFSRPLLIIEGENLFGLRNIHPNAIRGAIYSVSVDFRIPIIWTKTIEETAEVLSSLAKREQLDLERDVQIKGVKKPLTESEALEVFVAGIPAINLKLAKRLLLKFKTVRSIANANEKELKEVDGIGAEKAKMIRAFFERKYNL